MLQPKKGQCFDMHMTKHNISLCPPSCGRFMYVHRQSHEYDRYKCVHTNVCMYMHTNSSPRSASDILTKMHARSCAACLYVDQTRAIKPFRSLASLFAPAPMTSDMCTNIGTNALLCATGFVCLFESVVYYLQYMPAAQRFFFSIRKPHDRQKFNVAAWRLA